MSNKASVIPSHADLQVRARNLGLTYNHVESCVGPDHLLMWTCAVEICADSIPKWRQTFSAMPTKKEAELAARAAAESYLQSVALRPSIEVDDSWYPPAAMSSSSVPELTRCDDRADPRLAHLLLLCNELSIDDVSTVAMWEYEVYAPFLISIMAARGGHFAALAKAHNAIMHAINGNQDRVIVSVAHSKSKTLRAVAQRALDRMYRRDVPFDPEVFVSTFVTVFNERRRRYMAERRAGEPHAQFMQPVQAAVLRSRIQANREMHALNGNGTALRKSTLVKATMLFLVALVTCASASADQYVSHALTYTAPVGTEHQIYYSLGCTESPFGFQLPPGLYQARIDMQPADGHRAIIYQDDRCSSQGKTFSVISQVATSATVVYTEFNATHPIDPVLVAYDPSLVESGISRHFYTTFLKNRPCVCAFIRGTTTGRVIHIDIETASSQARHQWEISGADAAKAASHNKAMHALNGNQFLHGTLSARRVNKDVYKTRPKRIMGQKWRKVMKQHGIYGPAIGAFVQATDTFHDEGYDVVAWPSTNTNRSLTIANPATIAISKPAQIADDVKWDLHVIASNIACPLPYLQLHEGQSLDGVANGVYCTGTQYAWNANNEEYGNVLTYPAGAVAGSAVFPVGVVAVAAPTGVDTVPGSYTNPVTDLDSLSYGVQIPLPIDLVRGEHRIVGYAFEATNVSQALDKPGMVHVYRQPYQSKLEAVQGSASAPETAGYAFKQAMMTQKWVPNIKAVKSITDAKGWEAKMGCYVVARPVGMPAVHRPTMATPVGRPNQVEDFDALNTGVVFTTGACGVKIGGTPGAKTLTVVPTEFAYHHWDVSGAYFTGLDNETVIQIDAMQLIEHIPNPGNPKDSLFCRLAKLPPNMPPRFEAVFTKTMSLMPPGVPVSQNEWGEWWEKICSVVEAMAPVADAFVPGASAYVASSARAAKMVPHAVKTARKIFKPKANASVKNVKKIMKPK